MGIPSADVQGWLATRGQRRRLRFITCGAVDDGKSTLIGRLLYESGVLFDEQLAELRQDARRRGATPEALNFALLLDGLTAEREQGITIDVAYRFFETAYRRFVVADTPGHEQYTRNMVTGASTAEVAVLVVDARKGPQPQTLRHVHLAAVLGIRHLAVAVNKMDLVDEDEATFRAVADECRAFALDLGFDRVTCLPVCATRGDNVTRPSEHLPWYHGTTLLGFLETVDCGDDRLAQQPLRLPVQWVCRPAADFRGFAGTVAGGRMRVGDAVQVLPSGARSTVSRIVTAQGDLEHAGVGEPVTLTLADAVDVSRGDVICAAAAPAPCADQFECTLVWMDTEPALPGRAYLLKLATTTVNAQITDIKYEVDIGSRRQLAARQLACNAIAVCNLGLDRPIAYEAYRDNPTLGAFVLIDRQSQRTVCAGMLHFALRRSQTLQPQPFDVDKALRSRLKGQRPCVVWLTGLSGAGKSAIANALETRLARLGRHTYVLDGDNVRHRLNKDLGFDAPARVENIRRAAEVARLMVDAGLIVIAAFISPFRAEREQARGFVAADEFVEVHVDLPFDAAEQRDPRGLYRQARRGDIKHFPGISIAYEPPSRPEVHLDMTRVDTEAAAEQVLAALRARGIVGS